MGSIWRSLFWLSGFWSCNIRPGLRFYAIIFGKKMFSFFNDFTIEQCTQRMNGYSSASKEINNKKHKQMFFFPGLLHTNEKLDLS